MEPDWIRQALTKALGESFTDTVLQAFWLWVFGLVASAVVTIWAYIRGARGPAMYFAGGAVFGIATMVALTVLLLWSKPAFYSGVFAMALALLLRWWSSFRTSEQMRLNRYEKGFHDHLRDHSRGQRDAVRAMGAITKETARNGRQAERFTRYITAVGQFRLGHELIVWLAARSFRKSAGRFGKQAQRLAAAHQIVMAAGDGVVQFWADADNAAQIQEHRKAIAIMQVALQGTIPQSVNYAKTIRTSPSMSRAYNAAKTELADAIESTISSFHELDAYCTRLLKRLE